MQRTNNHLSEHEDLIGVDLVGGMSQSGEDIIKDGYGHGTHVAGTMTAMNNDLGVVGVTLGTGSLYIVKIFDFDGNWGSKAHASDLVANKLGLEGTIETSEINWGESDYEAWGGTFMAAPHVSGVAALVWSAYPQLTNVEILEALDATAFDLGEPGRDIYYGFGLVQAFDAIQYLSGSGQGPKGPNK